MQVLNAIFDILQAALEIERPIVMIDAIPQGLIVLSETQSADSTIFNIATLVCSDVQMWLLFK